MTRPVSDTKKRLAGLVRTPIGEPFVYETTLGDGAPSVQRIRSEMSRLRAYAARQRLKIQQFSIQSEVLADTTRDPPVDVITLVRKKHLRHEFSESMDLILDELQLDGKGES